MGDRFHEQQLDYIDLRLISWARWMREKPYLGAPQTACGCVGGGYSYGWDQWEADVDNRLDLATDAAIGDLGPLERLAIHHTYLAAVYRAREPLETVLERAREGVRTGLIRRNVWVGA